MQIYEVLFLLKRKITLWVEPKLVLVLIQAWLNIQEEMKRHNDFVSSSFTCPNSLFSHPCMNQEEEKDEIGTLLHRQILP